MTRTWIVFSLRRLVFGFVQTREGHQHGDVVALVGSRSEVLECWFERTTVGYLTIAEATRYKFD